MSFELYAPALKFSNTCQLFVSVEVSFSSLFCQAALKKVCLVYITTSGTLFALVVKGGKKEYRKERARSENKSKELEQEREQERERERDHKETTRETS